MGVPMPLTFLLQPEVLEELPAVKDEKDMPTKKENRLARLNASVQEENKEAETILDLSLAVIFKNVVSTVGQVFEDLIESDWSLRSVIRIISQGDRLIYLGIFLIITSMLLYFAGVTGDKS
jgi:hypothetical protein